MVSMNENGAALVFAILIVVALFVLGSGMAILTRTDIDISRNQRQDVQALYVAEAGVEEALYRLSLPWPTTMNVNGSSINAAIADTSRPIDPNWKVRVFLATPGSEPTPGGTEFHTVTIQPESDWLEYSSDSDLDMALTIEHKWKDLDDDGVRESGEIVFYDASKFPPENFATGSPVEVITLAGTRGNAERNILVEAIRYPINVNARAALFCDKGVDVRGNVEVCGHDHSFLTPYDTTIPACMVYEYCSGRTNCIGTGCVPGIMTTGDEVDRRGSSDVQGSPTPMDTSSSNQFLTLAETLGLSQAEVDEILANADYHSSRDANPLDGITYFIGDATGGETFNNVMGSGLLYVTGDLDCAGNFGWKGLIYVEGDFKITGTPWVLGAIVVKGTSDYAFTGGDPAILFSSEAIDYYIRQHLKYVEIGWKELAQQ
ncbi:MAG: pilus assembly PilX N-terminal domain-containing protein [bacterium]